MGDRSYCTLKLIGDVPDEILKLVDYELTPEIEIEENHWGIEEVNWGHIPRAIVKACVEHGISFIWTNEAGYEYSQGYWLYDAEKGRAADFIRNETEIVISAQDASSPGMLENALKWQEWIDANTS